MARKVGETEPRKSQLVHAIAAREKLLRRFYPRLAVAIQAQKARFECFLC
jgi:hypothetical protein